METRVHFAYFADDYPVVKLANFTPCRVNLVGLGRVLLVSNRTHVMVIAVVNERLRFVP